MLSRCIDVISILKKKKKNANEFLYEVEAFLEASLIAIDASGFNEL